MNNSIDGPNDTRHLKEVGTDRGPIEEPNVACAAKELIGSPDGDTPNVVSFANTADITPFQTGQGSSASPERAPDATVPEVDIEEAGTVLGDYEILEMIAQGGMGVVYKARQISLNRIVALKTLRTGPSNQVEQVERLRGEAQLAANLHHPHIVPIYFVGEDNGRHFFTMEYVGGGTLADRLQTSAFPAKEAAQWLTVIADAVGWAHGRSIIHRDLKPGNILIDEQGRPLVSDFGLAREYSVESSRTETGMIVGTASYMAPEQARGVTSQLTAQADIYSLGAVLYEMLTGRPPFKATNQIETLIEVRTKDPVAPRRIQSGIPRDIETICLKCLEKNPRNRYATAAELIGDLQLFLAGFPIVARRPSLAERTWKWVRRRPMVAALSATVTVFAAAMLWAAFALAWETGRRREAENTATVQSQLRRTAEDKAEADRQLRSVSEQLAKTHEYYALVNAARRQNAESLLRPRPGWVGEQLDAISRAASINTEAQNPTVLRSLGAELLSRVEFHKVGELGENLNAGAVAFSPDGKLVAVGKKRGILLCTVHVFDVETHAPLHVLSMTSFRRIRDTGVCALGFSPSGRWLAAGSRGGEMYIWDMSVPTPNPVPGPTTDDRIGHLAFHPISERLIYSSGNTLSIWDVSERRLLGTHDCPHPINGLAISPDGELLACGGRSALTLFAGDKLGLAIPEFSIVDGPKVALELPCFNSDGRMLAGFLDGSHLAVFPVRDHSLGPHRILHEQVHEEGVTRLQFSPDDSLLISGSDDRSVHVFEVATARRLATWVVAGDNFSFPAFSPDKRHVASIGDRTTELYSVHGLNHRKTIAHHDQPIRTMALSPNGEELACLSGSYHGSSFEGRVTIWDIASGRLQGTWSIRGSGADLLRLPPSMAYHPDGSTIAVSGHSQDKFDLWDVSRGDHRGTIPVREPAFLRFAANGDSLWATYRTGTRVPQVGSWTWPELATRSVSSNLFSHVTASQSKFLGLDVGHRWAVAGSADRTLKLTAVDGGEPDLAEFSSPNQQQVTSVALSPDETQAAFGTRDGRAYMVQLPAGTVTELAASEADKAHGDSIDSMMFRPDGNLLVTGSNEGTLRLWHREYGAFRELFTLPGRTPVVTVVFDPSGNHLVALFENEFAVRVWNLETLKNRLSSMQLDW